MLKYEVDVIKQYKVENILFKKPTKIPPLSPFDIPEVDIDYKKGGSGGNIYDIIGPPKQGPWFEEWDNNLFFNDIGEFRAAAHFIRENPRRHVLYNLQDWREMGYDLHSIYADPMFIDPENGDYRVKPESPAIKLGFRNFKMGTWGLTDELPEKWRNVRN